MYLKERTVGCSWLHVGTDQEEKKKQLLTGLLEVFGVLLMLSSSDLSKLFSRPSEFDF